jgi:hypothetical protein
VHQAEALIVYDDFAVRRLRFGDPDRRYGHAHEQNAGRDPEFGDALC